MTAAARLAELIACRTVSAPDERDETQFASFRETFARLYPNLHAELEQTQFAGGSLLFRWPGRSPERPLVLMAHYDVVPAPAEQWDRDPFSGLIEDGFVHGRGTLDDKGPLVCIAEAVESLLEEGFEPARDVYLSFGADEEVFGHGAADIVDHLDSMGVRPWLVSDEGGAIVDDVLPGVSALTAMVAIVEKGTVDVGLLARGGGGHASTPAKNGATARLAGAIIRIERHPATPHLSDPVLQMLDALADLVPRPVGAVLHRARHANRPVAELLARLGKETGAIVRTTMAVTQISGSPARNVLATEARANVNVRLAVGDTREKLVHRLERLFRGLDVEVERVDGEDPPPVSRTDNDAWRALGEAIAVLDPDIHVVPYVQTGGTDSRHFTRISDSVYRFAPLQMTRAQRDSIHAPNEKVAVETLERGSAFHRALITNMD